MGESPSLNLIREDKRISQSFKAYNVSQKTYDFSHSPFRPAKSDGRKRKNFRSCAWIIINCGMGFERMNNGCANFRFNHESWRFLFSGSCY